MLIEETEGLENVGEIARVLNADPAWYDSLRLPPAGIAILDPKLPRIVAAGEGSDRYVMESQLGAYAALRGLGHRVDFVHEDEVVSGGLAPYRMLVVPFAYAMDAATADAIGEWTRAGGTLVAGMWCAAKDGHGYGQPFNPGLGLHEVFGAHEYELQPVLSDADRTGTDMSFGYGQGASGHPVVTLVAAVREDGAAKPGQTFEGLAYLSRLTPHEGAQVIAVDGTGAPVVVHNRHGDGRALLVGTFPARPVAEQFRVDALSHLLDDLARAAGVAAPARVTDPVGSAVEAELLRGGGDRDLVVVMNAVQDEVTAEVRIAGTVRAAYDAETREPISVKGSGEETELYVPLTGGDGRAIIVERM